MSEGDDNDIETRHFPSTGDRSVTTGRDYKWERPPKPSRYIGPFSRRWSRFGLRLAVSVATILIGLKLGGTSGDIVVVLGVIAALASVFTV